MKKGNISKPYYLYLLTDFSKRITCCTFFFCKKRDLGFWQELHKIGFELGQFFLFGQKILDYITQIIFLVLKAF